MSTDVTETLQNLNYCNKIVTDLINIRKDAKFSQEFMAYWLQVFRKKLNEFENGNFDFILMLNYAEKLSVEIKITHIIH